MLAGLGRLIHRRRWTSLVLILLLTGVAGVWSLGVFGKFKQGGFEDPDASSTLVSKLSSSYFGNTTPDVLVLYRSDTMTVDDPRYMSAVLTTVSRLPEDRVPEVISYWSFEGGSAAPFVSHDRRSTFVALKIAGKGDPARVESYDAIKDRLTAPGLDTRYGGAIPLGVEFGEQVIADIVNAEILSLPVLLILLVILFGALAAAVQPLIVAAFSIVGALAVVHSITYITGVTSFALEAVTLMGVGLAIDYSLFVVARFREELRRTPDDRQAALAATMATAGRTIIVSGVTVTAALAGLLLFPQMYLRTIGLGGMATVMVSVFGATVLLPTLLAILGPRVEFGRMPWRRRTAARRESSHAARVSEGSSSPLTGTGAAERGERGFWYRLGHSVMRHPVPYFAIVLVILAVLFGPFLRVQFNNVDARALPQDSPTRAVAETVKRDFPNGSAEPIDVVISGDLIPRDWRPAKDKVPPYLERFRQRLAALPHVREAAFTGYSQSYGGVRISVTHDAEPMSGTARSLVDRIRGMGLAKDGIPMHVDVGGTTAAQMDLMASLKKTLPWMILLVGFTTFFLLFMFFGSIVLPLKAIVMNVLSIGASFGAIVWGFQDGHLAGPLGFTATGGVEATSMILILAVVFGLSMDYEVFLLSRIREEWDRTGDNRTAVAVGMQRTGAIITSAALLFLVVIAAFGMAGITVIKLLGVGMFVAVVVDAALVRSLLVPATMRFMGAANWWLPRPLAGLHARIDLREHGADPGPAPAAEPAGRDAIRPPRTNAFGRWRRPRTGHRAAPPTGPQTAPGTGPQAAPPTGPQTASRIGPQTASQAASQAGPQAGPVPVVRADVTYPVHRHRYDPNRPTRRPPSPEPRDEPPVVPAEAGRWRPPKPAEPPAPARPAKPAKPARPARPARPAKPVAPVEPARSARGAEQQPEPRPRREIVPNPEGAGWHWRTVEDDDAN